METIAAHPRASAPADDGRTRDRVSALLLEHGPQTATELAGRLGISPAAVRQLTDAGGMVTEYKFTDVRMNIGLADSLFVFRAPPEVEVIDLRW